MKLILSTITLIICLVVSVNSFSQKSPRSDYDWESDPKPHDIPEDWLGEEEIVLKRWMAHEFLFGDDDNLYEYKTYHTIRQVNSADAIEDNQEIYLNVEPGSLVVYQKARVINPDGKVIELNESDIKEATEGEGVAYKYFALEGLEPGSEIEYLYRVKRSPKYDGNLIYLQNGQPQLNVELEVHYPWLFEFEYKGYNGIDSVRLDTTAELTTSLNISLARVDALESESSAFFWPHLKAFAYKLDNSLYTGGKDIISFGGVSENLYNALIAQGDSKEIKAVTKLVKQMQLDRTKGDESTVRQLESYLKSEFNILDYGVPDFEVIPAIMKQKVCNNRGMIRLFTQTLRELGIDYRVVLTSDRSGLYFDPEFESYHVLEEVMIYLNKLDLYLAPTELFTCLGYPPPEWMYNHGLFIKEVSVLDYRTGIGEVKWIKELPAEATQSNMWIDASLDLDEETVDIHYKGESTGYYAGAVQPIFAYYDETQAKEVEENVVKFMHENAEIVNSSVSNVQRGNYGVLPFVAEADLKCQEFLTTAGDKLLFKIGEIIGPQVEMYQEKERVLPVENTYNHQYHREINFTIPAGYEVSNLDDLILDVVYSEDGNAMLGFTSRYTLEGNVVHIVIEEYYKLLYMEPAGYTDYSKVINAAADFNKIVLVLKAS
jgi:hypothetical protein